MTEMLLDNDKIKVPLIIYQSPDIIELDEVWAMKAGAIIWQGTSTEFTQKIDILGEQGITGLVVHPDIWVKWKDSEIGKRLQ